MDCEPGVGDIIHLKHPSGSTTTIARLGATVLSLQTPRAGEILWLDPDWPQPTSGSNNRHGGIPVMFPTFGNVQDERIVGKGDQQDMRRWMVDTPHHGFAKDCVWDLVTTDDNENDWDWPIIENETSHDHLSRVVLRVCPAHVPADLRGSWLRESGDWEILYRISLHEDGLIQDFCVKNKNTREDVSGDLRAKNIVSQLFPSIESEAGNLAQSDNVLSFKVPGGADHVLTLKNKNTMNVVMDDNMHQSTTQFDIMATNLPDVGKSAEMDTFPLGPQINGVKEFLEADEDIVVWAPKVNEQIGHAVKQDTYFVCIETGSVVEPFAVPIGRCTFFRQILSA